VVTPAVFIRLSRSIPSDLCSRANDQLSAVRTSFNVARRARDLHKPPGSSRTSRSIIAEALSNPLQPSDVQSLEFAQYAPRVERLHRKRIPHSRYWWSHPQFAYRGHTMRAIPPSTSAEDPRRGSRDWEFPEANREEARARRRTSGHREIQPPRSRWVCTSEQVYLRASIDRAYHRLRRELGRWKARLGLQGNDLGRSRRQDFLSGGAATKSKGKEMARKGSEDTKNRTRIGSSP
jgi:hypothetical protein